MNVLQPIGAFVSSVHFLKAKKILGFASQLKIRVFSVDAGSHIGASVTALGLRTTTATISA